MSARLSASSSQCGFTYRNRVVPPFSTESRQKNTIVDGPDKKYRICK